MKYIIFAMLLLLAMPLLFSYLYFLRFQRDAIIYKNNLPDLNDPFSSNSIKPTFPNNINPENGLPYWQFPWRKSVHNTNANYVDFKIWLNHHNNKKEIQFFVSGYDTNPLADLPATNPATGLPMVGGGSFDTMGNPYGTSDDF